MGVNSEGLGGLLMDHLMSKEVEMLDSISYVFSKYTSRGLRYFFRKRIVALRRVEKERSFQPQGLESSLANSKRQPQPTSGACPGFSLAVFQ